MAAGVQADPPLRHLGLHPRGRRHHRPLAHALPHGRRAGNPQDQHGSRGGPLEPARQDPRSWEGHLHCGRSRWRDPHHRPEVHARDRVGGALPAADPAQRHRLRGDWSERQRQEHPVRHHRKLRQGGHDAARWNEAPRAGGHRVALGKHRGDHPAALLSSLRQAVGVDAAAERRGQAPREGASNLRGADRSADAGTRVPSQGRRH
mmetsp:Transcript_83823/g.222475  ORF Transcript_83823/g.222475 Transcript_83823/m.222475 type:complete len:205 (+) Transcript_83823:247-861(+)